jgi:arylformamidase
LKVYLDYTQQDLDERVFNTRLTGADPEAIVRRFDEASRLARERLGARTERYGPGAEQLLDVFPAASGKAPVHLFVHGGAWRSLGRQSFGFLAPPFVEQGASFVAIDFAQIPQATLPQMCRQVGEALRWVLGNAPSFGGDPAQVFISGHSSGGHLAALTLARAGGQLKGGVLLSGLYDLVPVLMSRNFAHVRVDSADFEALTPLQNAARIAAPVILAYGELDAVEAGRQARSFESALRGAGRRVERVEIPGANHWNVVESLPRLALPQMGLGASIGRSS